MGKAVEAVVNFIKCNYDDYTREWLLKKNVNTSVFNEAKRMTAFCNDLDPKDRRFVKFHADAIVWMIKHGQQRFVREATKKGQIKPGTHDRLKRCVERDRPFKAPTLDAQEAE
jgi:hypothetical protein